ncbi:jg17660 [Pararge aegeria aegeria]|uniref:Jg17660 protein n=1 Tax=Pararge aegeria aegeria TaxID=348720 RepID=A0A8S4RI62_9NEOP|nr:jg17660 [Pararge aegeria aegeria]
MVRCDLGAIENCDGLSLNGDYEAVTPLYRRGSNDIDPKTVEYRAGVPPYDWDITLNNLFATGALHYLPTPPVIG